MEAEQGVAVSAPAFASTPPFACDAAEVAASLGTDPASGLSAADAAVSLNERSPCAPGERERTMICSVRR